MASSSSLHLFPSASYTSPPPRKSSLKHATRANNSGELKGLALQLTAHRNATPTIQPASDHIKHSLFCDPAPSIPGPSRQNSPPGAAYKRRRSSRHIRKDNGSPTSDANPSLEVEEDQLTPLPVNTHFGSSSSLTRKPSSKLKRPPLPWQISVEAQPDLDMPLKDDDQLSPLPEKTRFTPPSPKMPEYPAPISHRSASPPLFRSNSKASRAPQSSPAYTAPIRSMFPQYDHSKPLNEQHYYPTSVTAQPLPSEKVSKICSPIVKPTLKRYDSGIDLSDGYENVPTADSNDLLAISNACKGQFPVTGRKVQLAMHQPKTQDVSLLIGIPAEQPLYSLVKPLPQQLTTRDEAQVRRLAIERSCPKGGASVPVLQLALPLSPRQDAKSETEVTDIFPQQAAIHAIETVANSPAASAIATFDPTAASPEAARLACDAVAEARRRHACELVRSNRKRDSLGTVTANYNLESHSLGVFPVTVTKTTSSASRVSKAKICLHHPTATPAAVAAESLVLASLDFARDACVLDTPGLLALESPYIIDTAISTLLAVAAIENAAVMAETLTFAPPPKTPIKESSGRTKSRSRVKKADASSNRRWYKRSAQMIDKAEKALVGDPPDVPAVAQGAVALLGLSLKGAVLLLETGVRVTTKVVTHVASKV